MLASPLMPVLPPGLYMPSFPSVPKVPISLPSIPRQAIVKPSIPILVQTRPQVTSIPVIRPSLPPGLIPLPDTPKYDPTEMIDVGPPNISSEANNDAQTLQVIDSVPKMKSLPAIVYRVNPQTNKLTRYLADWRDPDYDTDPNYGISQEWLLFNRQGDQYDRLPEWVPYSEIADPERVNLQDATTLNIGRIWGGLPRSRIIELYRHRDLLYSEPTETYVGSGVLHAYFIELSDSTALHPKFIEVYDNISPNDFLRPEFSEPLELRPPQESEWDVGYNRLLGYDDMQQDEIQDS